MGHPPNNRGFTLLELIVVMALIALTASFTVPRLADLLYADQLKVNVRKLVGLIHQASTLAQRDQKPHLLKYFENEHRFVVVPEAKAETTLAGDDTTEAALLLAESVRVGEFWFWYGGARSGEDRVIRFSKEGYVEPTILYLRKENGQEMSVVLSPFLGKVRVIDGHVVPETDTFSR
ncbi:hypothetical protein Despr_0657 [Desulfobulbus propionicus DSM 2032]|uniref:Prepilin-type N-terminal cleavage/methylation domain-containing protein n=1 Tax=Desulfobulbus propionicus (strain ATCC 33891 / DSM 2032 / VKM B-1956 / 1pr3) TaxID=577650 RepID=A0A7U3YK27_DESPD|nr:type II secretion system protein [Desulfobulbus propionicus]ADW16833.1 hypothetical protein Despr_0657 [Desulfobulbus propionicus DSM 2032]